MCGIAGGWLPKESGRLAGAMEHALATMAHRGPNDRGLNLFEQDRGVLALGQTRLSIIDLSAAGHQPMFSRDGMHAIVFNGEIYNYRELREELRNAGQSFTSDTDTEVLLAAWLQWGPECLRRLAGMFAFVVFDRAANTLTCVRDAFGIKPFFYTQEDGAFLFASEIHAIVSLKKNKPELNWQRAYDYLVHGDYDSNAQTFFADVHHLPPGHLLTIDLSSGNVDTPPPWWKPDISERRDLSFAEAAERVREQFLQNIRLHLRSDVPLGAALSGGIDSSAVVCAMRHVEPDLPINTFSYIARDSDVSEEVWVDRVNTYVNAMPHKVVVNPEELANDLDTLIQLQGEPFGSTSIYAQYRVFQLARQNGVTVTLEGQGADEMLAGYNGYPGQRLRSLVEEGRLLDAWDFMNEWSKWPGRSRSAAFKRGIGEVTSGWLYRTLRELNGMNALPTWLRSEPLLERGVVRQYPRQRSGPDAHKRRVVAELSNALTGKGLPALLRHGDRNSMHFSVEGRVPFLTLDMVELLLSLPESFLISPKGETKSVFRAAMRGIVPDDVLDRRDKIGFATPELAWFRSMSPTIRSWLADDLQVPFIDQAAMLKEYDQVISGEKPFSWQVWRWINFCCWYRRFLA